MIRKVSLGNFKCFKDAQEFPLSRITLLYGKNGRGKSSLVQSILLLSQTLRTQNNLQTLVLNGEFTSIGTFADLHNVYADADVVNIVVEDSESQINMIYNAQGLRGLTINQEEMFQHISLSSGENPDESVLPLTISDNSLLQWLKNTVYISAERNGPRNIEPKRDGYTPSKPGIHGEYIYNNILANGREFSDKVREALSRILDGASLNVFEDDLQNVRLEINSTDSGKLFKPVNVGFGYSFILPIIVSLLNAKENSLLIIENPEAHLHPGAQSRLMDFIISISNEKHLQIIIETHSDHLVNGMRLSLKNGIVTPQETGILFFSHSHIDEQPQVKSLICDANGELSEYPDDFLDEWTKQLIGLV